MARSARAATIAALLAALPCAAVADGALKVCSDPNNLPFSNRAQQGFENEIAEKIAGSLGETVSYAWAEQGKNFLRDTLNAGRCDVVMGIPADAGDVETTLAYYESSYVFVYRDGGPPISSLSDPRLRNLRIGVHLIGDDSTPPTEALAREGIIDNVRGYMIYGDYARPNPPSRLIEAVEDGEIDVAAVWGPFAGYFARRSPVKLDVTPIEPTRRFAPLVFRFAIAMGVRKGDDRLKRKLDAAIEKNRASIGNILLRYGVPLVKGG
ncbi:MAG TPA: substrate-binding domain-containing protein [Rhizomicrobium sp.]|nr:substrate-binding domain-containing protein [Rhizomicrobium sp.]